MNYSTRGLGTILDIVAYTVKAMKEIGSLPGDIEEYLIDIAKENNLSIIAESKEQLERCNEIASTDLKQESDWFEDTWRDHYYSSIWEDEDIQNYGASRYWDDDGRYDDPAEDTHLKHYWDDDNAVDDVETDEEREAYEGFSSCKKTYWDCTDDDDDFWKIHDSLDTKKDQSYDPWNDDF